MARLHKNSVNRSRRPSGLSEGEALEVSHAGVFYSFIRNYGMLDFVVGPEEPNDDGLDVVAIRFGKQYGSELEEDIADKIWYDIVAQFDSTKVWDEASLERAPNYAKM